MDLKSTIADCANSIPDDPTVSCATSEREPHSRLGRKISTSKDLKSHVYIREGFLNKQSNKFHQKWSKYYFKLRSRKLYYAKTPEATIFNEIELIDQSIAECSPRGVSFAFKIITPWISLVLAADSRREADEWIKAISLVGNKEFYEKGGDQYRTATGGHHTWYEVYSGARPYYCNVCRLAFTGFTWSILSCELCRIKVHKLCATKVTDCCKWSLLDSLKDTVLVDQSDNYLMPHQWVEGNLPISAKCFVCNTTCGSVLRLQDWRCLWCSVVLHSACLESYPKRCPLGRCRTSIVAPIVIATIDLDGHAKLTDKCSVSSGSPLLVFVNTKSGQNQGVRVLRKMKQVLNPCQIYDLMNGGPEFGLAFFNSFNTFRILVCGGDGSVAWALSAIDKLDLWQKCQLAVMPLGTGNDLSRVLGWGQSFDDRGTCFISYIEQLERAVVSSLDRWSVLTIECETAYHRLKKQLPRSFTEYEDSVGSHLATILESDKHDEVISSAKVLCSTVSDFLATVGAADKSRVAADTQQEHDSLSDKCHVLQQKLKLVLKALEEESSIAGTVVEKADTFDFDIDIVPSDRTSSADRVTAFVQRDVLMSRANSLKKALRQIIDQVEIALDDQNQQTIRSKVHKRRSFGKLIMSRRQSSTQSGSQNALSKCSVKSSYDDVPISIPCSSQPSSQNSPIPFVGVSIREQSCDSDPGALVSQLPRLASPEDSFDYADDLGRTIPSLAVPPSPVVSTTVNIVPLAERRGMSNVPPLFCTGYAPTPPSARVSRRSRQHDSFTALQVPSMAVQPPTPCMTPIPSVSSLLNESGDFFGVSKQISNLRDDRFSPGECSPTSQSSLPTPSPSPTAMRCRDFHHLSIDSAGPTIPHGASMSAETKRRLFANRELGSSEYSLDVGRGAFSMSSLAQRDHRHSVIGTGGGRGTRRVSTAKSFERSPSPTRFHFGSLSAMRGRTTKGGGNTLSSKTQTNSQDSAIANILLMHADMLALLAPIMVQDDVPLDRYVEKCVMNNYFGIGLDAKITFDFNSKRDEADKMRSRRRLLMFYGMLGAKELFEGSFKNLEQKVRLECDGKEIRLPRLQALVVLNIESYQGGANFWKTRKPENSESGHFVRQSFDDQLVEVLAIFGALHCATSRVSDVANYRVAQCRHVKISIIGDDPLPVQVDGEAWMQPPGLIQIVHKNKANVLIRNKEFEATLKSWTALQETSSTGRPASLTRMYTEEESDIILSFLKTSAQSLDVVKKAIMESDGLDSGVGSLLLQCSQSISKLYPSRKVSELSHIGWHLSDCYGLMRQLHHQLMQYTNASNPCPSQDEITTVDLSDTLVALGSVLDASGKVFALSYSGFEEDNLGPSVMVEMGGNNVPRHVKHGTGRRIVDWLRGKSLPSKKKSGQSGHHESMAEKSFSIIEVDETVSAVYDSWSVVEVIEWLQEKGLGEYSDNFMEHDIQGKELVTLTRDDLTQLGMTKIGHVKRILRCIDELHQSDSGCHVTAGRKTRK